MANTITDSVTYDNLLLGDLPLISEEMEIAQSQTLVRGTVVGKITASGYYVACAHDAVDGSQTPIGVLMSDVTTTTAELPGTMYVFGLFNEDDLTFGGTSTIADLRDAMRLAGLYVKAAATL